MKHLLIQPAKLLKVLLGLVVSNRADAGAFVPRALDGQTSIFVVASPFTNLSRAVNLFAQQEACDLVREGHRAKAEKT